MGSGWYLQAYHPPPPGRVRRTGAGRRADRPSSPTVSGRPASCPGVDRRDRGVARLHPGRADRGGRAAAMAQRDTGRAAVPAPAPAGSGLLATRCSTWCWCDCGVRPARVVLCHLRPVRRRPGLPARALADRGRVAASSTMIGMPYRFTRRGPVPRPRRHRARPWPASSPACPRRPAADSATTVFLKTMLSRYGGNGLSYVPTLFLRSGSTEKGGAGGGRRGRGCCHQPGAGCSSPPERADPPPRASTDPCCTDLEGGSRDEAAI